ncbi:MAG: HAD family hydrolase, partial [Okeania sp. SIO2H7]|nr:HAD family hydrolase [Okeania sp. SIO2H7]
LLMAFGLDGDSMDRTGLLAAGSRQENEIAAAAYIAETGRGWLESLTIARNAFNEASAILKTNVPSPIFEGTREVLKYLWESGLKLGILSADSTEGVRAFVRHYQLEDYIQLLKGVDSGPSKPDPILFLEACQKLTVEPEACLMVGDSPSDWEMGKKAGAAGCIGICWGNSEASHLQGADVAIASLPEIKVKN